MAFLIKDPLAYPTTRSIILVEEKEPIIDNRIDITDEIKTLITEKDPNTIDRTLIENTEDANDPRIQIEDNIIDTNRYLLINEIKEPISDKEQEIDVETEKNEIITKNTNDIQEVIMPSLFPTSTEMTRFDVANDKIPDDKTIESSRGVTIEDGGIAMRQPGDDVMDTNGYSTGDESSTDPEIVEETGVIDASSGTDIITGSSRGSGVNIILFGGALFLLYKWFFK